MSLDDERIEAASNLRVEAMRRATREARLWSSEGAQRITQERRRQKVIEGYTDEHDKGHAEQLGWAGAAYALGAVYVMRGEGTKPTMPKWWPWASDYWRPTGDPVRDLEKAGALIAAAIDSLTAERASMGASEGSKS